MPLFLQLVVHRHLLSLIETITLRSFVSICSKKTKHFCNLKRNIASVYFKNELKLTIDCTRFQCSFLDVSEKWTQTYETFKSTHFIKLNLTGSSTSDYLLSKEPNSTAMQSDVMCHLLGGYLAEVSPREEQDITQALRTSGNGRVDLILIGGSDVDGTGNWLYMRNELPLKLNVSLPAAPGQDCLAFDTKASFRVVQTSCSNPSSSGTSLFLCQIDT